MNSNQTYFMLGVSVTALAVVAFKELSPPRQIQTRTETIVRLVAYAYNGTIEALLNCNITIIVMIVNNARLIL